MTRAHTWVVGVLLGAALLGFAPAGARQPPRVEPVASAVVADNKQGIATCAGLAFLHDGARVVVRWERHHFGDRPSEARLLVVGPRGELSAPVAVSPTDFRLPAHVSRTAVTRSGDVLTADGVAQLLLQPVGPAPTPPARRIVLTGAPPSWLWLAGPADDVYQLRAGEKTAYQLVTVAGAALTEGKGATRVLLEGGKGGWSPIRCRAPTFTRRAGGSPPRCTASNTRTGGSTCGSSARSRRRNRSS